MAELLKSGRVFIHVPKCGGTWVRHVLRNLGLGSQRVGFKHSTPKHINEILRYRPWHFIRHWPRRPIITPRKLRNAVKFCFVRNPLSWYESWWKYMAGNWQSWEPGRWHPQRPIDRCGDDDFNSFAENVLEERPGFVSEMYRWYVDDSVRYVGKFETLADDLIDILHRCGEDFDEQVVPSVAPVNVSAACNGQPRWDSQLLHRMIDAEIEAIDRFNYHEAVEVLVSTR